MRSVNPVTEGGLVRDQARWTASELWWLAHPVAVGVPIDTFEELDAEVGPGLGGLHRPVLLPAMDTR